MDISLSFRITRSCRPKWPALLIPSKASPPVMDPSPIIAATRKSSLFWWRPSAIPRAEEMDVEACPAPITS